MSIDKVEQINYRDVLNFWYGEETSELHYPKSRSDLWFRNGRHYDTEITHQFSRLHQLAREGHLDHWQEQAAGRLGLIIVLDQFSRHIYRETARAFAQDFQAQNIVLKGIEVKHDLQLTPAQQVFFYLPLEHAEDRELQELSVRKFTALVEKLPPDIQPEYASTLNFAVRHKEVIDRFGRFPDLNSILGRASTAEEIAFLTQPGSSFL